MRRTKHSKVVDTKKYFNHRQPWTKDDDELLDKLSDELPDDEISKIMGRTIPYIWNHRMKIDKEERASNE